MPAPYLEIFEFPNIGKLASVVLDREDFMSVIDEFEKMDGLIGGPLGMVRGDPAKFEALRQAEHLPMVMRGTKTEVFFQRFGIPDDVRVMSAIVRGGGKKIMERMTGGVKH